MLNRESVVKIHEIMLGRPPGSSVAIDELITEHKTQASLETSLRRTPEFRKKAKLRLKAPFRSTDGYQAAYCLPGLSGTNARLCEDRCAAIEKYLRGPLNCQHMGHLRILDIGCAQGYNALYFAERGATSSGIDSVATNIEFCNILANTLRLDTAFTHQPFSEDTLQFVLDQGINVVFMLSVLHHIITENGISWVKYALKRLLNNQVTIFAELAKQDEDVSFRWKDHLPSNELEVFGEDGVAATLVGNFAALNGKAIRPLYCIQRNLIEYNSTINSEPAHEVSARSLVHENILFSGVTNAPVPEKQYVRAAGEFGKIFRTNAARDRALARQRLSNELSISSRLAEAEVAPRLIGIFSTEACSGIIYEQIQGSDLAEFIKQNDVAARRRCAVNITHKYLDLRRVGIFWNDCRHHNILVRPDGRVYFVDFELASSKETEDNRRRLLWILWHLCHSEHGGLIPAAALPTSQLPVIDDNSPQACPEWAQVLQLLSSEGGPPEERSSVNVVRGGKSDVGLDFADGLNKVKSDSLELTLTELANRFRSDKGTTTGSPPHRYAHLYDLLFWPIRQSPINFLEIGLAVGGPEVGGPTERSVASPSVQMWLTYFRNARIYGFDISDFSHIENQRFTFVRGDSGSETDLKRLANVAPAFDVIIDDASHASFHQQLSFKMLFPQLAPGGIYIIEDLHWQSPPYEETLPKVPKTALFFQKFLEKEEYIPNELFSAEYMAQLMNSLASFSFFGAFDGSASPTKLLVMRKGGATSDIRITGGLANDDAPVGSPEELVGAAYKAILGRTPDPSGLNTYGRLFSGRTLGQGTESTIRGLLRSREFELKRTSPRRGQSAVECLFIQTADADKYAPMMEITSKTVREYCRRQSFSYEAVFGVIRGYREWHATFNRITLLRRLAEDGQSAWVCYMDADAFVADLNFDLRSYLAEKSEIAIIAADGGQPAQWWNINAGVLLINLANPAARAVIYDWSRRFSAITDDQLRGLKDWSQGPEDQSLLHAVLREMPGTEKQVLVERVSPRLINYQDGQFIRQLLRSTLDTFETRIERLREEVDDLMQAN